MDIYFRSLQRESRGGVLLTLILSVLAGCSASDTKNELYKGKYMGEKITKTNAEWKNLLTPEQFYVTRQKGTERAGTGEYAYNKDDGIYQCVCCGLPLFASEHKFDSGTGWPSFDTPMGNNHVAEEEDRGLFRIRTEVLCGRCDAHLGHVFPDGPPETTGLRYCINSAALTLEPSNELGEDKQ